MSSRWAAALFATLVAAISAGPVRADFYAGLEAHARGDYAKARAEWLPLAEAGDAAAQANLGVMYWQGQGVDADSSEAVRWFLLAAEKGDPDAQNNLGQMYYLGEGVPKDFDAAARWIKAAAYQDDPSAQLRLGTLYARGIGVARDPARALFWWRKSAAQGNAAAQVRIAEAAADDHVSGSFDPRPSEPGPSASDPQAPAIASSLPVANPHDVEIPPTVPDVPAVETPQAVMDMPDVASPPPVQSAPIARPIPAAPAPDVASGLTGDPASTAAAPTSNGFLVQIASVREEAEVEPEWKRLQRRNADLLGGLALDVQKAELGARVVYRLRAGPPRDRAAAETLCAALEERRIGCLLRAAP